MKAQLLDTQEMLQSQKDRNKEDKDRFRQLVDALKTEVKEKYDSQLGQLRKTVKDLRDAADRELSTRHKEVKKLHIQHQVEHDGIQEQFQYIYAKYKEKKEDIKELNSKMEEEKNKLQSQKQLYEKMMVEIVCNGN